MDTHHHSATRAANGSSMPSVAVLLYDHKTSGPVARADRVCKALENQGAKVSLLLGSHLLDDAIAGDNATKFEIDLESRWLPSKLNPERVIREVRPDILLVDDYPFVSWHGTNNRHLGSDVERVIKAARRSNPDVKIYSMVCDIPVYHKDERNPEIASKKATQVDKILVTGDKKITDFQHHFTDAQWGRFADKVNYAGYMIPVSQHQQAEKSGEILVYLGGSPLEANLGAYRTLIAGIAELPEAMQKAPWRFVLPANADMRLERYIYDSFAKLPPEIQSNIIIERAGPEYIEKVQAADMLIIRSGQSANEALAYGKPAVILPCRSEEQFARARRYKELGQGRLKVLFPEESGLREAMTSAYALRRVKPPETPIQCDGHNTIAAALIDAHHGIEPKFKGRSI